MSGEAHAPSPSNGRYAVIGFSVCAAEENYTLYEITVRVNSGGGGWLPGLPRSSRALPPVQRRFKEFKALAEAVRLSGRTSPVIPSSVLSPGLMASSRAAEFVARRKAALEAYMRDLFEAVEAGELPALDEFVSENDLSKGPSPPTARTSGSGTPWLQSLFTKQQRLSDSEGSEASAAAEPSHAGGARGKRKSGKLAKVDAIRRGQHERPPLEWSLVWEEPVDEPAAPADGASGTHDDADEPPPPEKRSASHSWDSDTGGEISPYRVAARHAIGPAVSASAPSTPQAARAEQLRPGFMIGARVLVRQPSSGHGCWSPARVLNRRICGGKLQLLVRTVDCSAGDAEWVVDSSRHVRLLHKTSMDDDDDDDRGRGAAGGASEARTGFDAADGAGRSCKDDGQREVAAQRGGGSTSTRLMQEVPPPALYSGEAPPSASPPTHAAAEESGSLLERARRAEEELALREAHIAKLESLLAQQVA